MALLKKIALLMKTMVIEFGDSYESPQEVVDTGSASEGSAKKKGRTVAVMTEDMQKRRNDVKAITTLLLALPDKHQLRFRKYKTAQELWVAILKTFGGNEGTKKTKKNQLKHQYGNFKVERKEMLKQTFNRLQAIISHLEFMDVEIEQDDLNQKFLTSLTPEWLMYTIIKYEDINQIDEDNIEEMDIKWNMALLSMRADRFWKKTRKKISTQGTDMAGFDKSKVECFNCHKMGHFSRESRAPRSQDRGRRENYKQGSKEEEQAPKALMEIDGVRWDWSYMENKEENHALVADEEAPTKFSLMAKSGSDSEGNSQNVIDDKGYWDSGCSRHMTGNISYLSDYEPYDRGYVSFGQGGCKITDKGTIKTGKQHKASCKTKFVNSVSKPLHTLHMDLFRPTFDETSGILRNFITEIENLKELKVNIIRCDNGGEFRNKEMNDFYSRKGNKREFSNARTPQQNRVAERRNKTLIDVARTMLTDAKLPITFWAEAVNTTCYVQNRVLVNKSQNKTPYELFNGRTLNIGFLKPFRCHVMILNTLDHLGKFEAKGDECYFIGYYMFSKAFMVFNKRTKRVEENLHVDFLENKLIEKGAGPNWLFNIDTLTNSMNYVPMVSAGTTSTNFSGTKDAASQDVKKDVTSLRYIALPNWFHEAHLESSTMETLIPTVSSPVLTACLDNSPQLSSDTRLISKRVTNQDYTPSLDNILTLTNRFEDILRVTTNTGDTNGVEADLSNMENNISTSPTLTFRIYKDHLKSQIISPVDTPVLKNKKDKRGIVIRNKVRPVAQGHTQKEGIDYEEVFAPIARIKPPRFQDLKFPARVYKVEKAMYGLHQAPRAWYDVRSANTPMDKENPWGKDRTGKDVDLYLYRSMIGSFMYLTASRPDIMFTVCACARHQVTPKECHLHAVKRIFSYLKSHPKLGIWYPKDSPFDLVAYSDSDYGGATQDRKSTTGGCQFLGRRLISWQCKKQTIVATSTIKAEYVAAASGCRQVLWIQNQLLDYGFAFCDYHNMIAILEKYEYNIDFHPILDFVEASYIRYALTINPIQQFWSTARVETSDEGTKILATVTGEGLGTPTEPHHTPFPKAPQSPQHNLSSSMHPPVTTTTIPTIIPTDIPTLRQYSRRARIAQSLALLTATDKPASPLGDDSQDEACPTVSGLEAKQDMANIIKTSTLPYYSTPRLLPLLLMRAKGDEPSREDAIIKGRSLETREEEAVEKSTERGSNDTKELVNVLTSLDAASILISGVQVVSVPPAAEVATVSVPTGSGMVPTASPIFTTASVVTPYSRQKGKEKMVESDTPNKKKLQKQIDVHVAREIKEQISREDQRMNEQIVRDAKIARIHVEEELQMLIDSLYRNNETIAKYLQEYEQFVADLDIEERIDMINDLVKYQDRWKTKHFKGMSLEEIREKFIPVWKQIKDFVPMGSREEGENVKRKGLRLEQESAKKVKTLEEVSEEDLKTMMLLVSVKDVHVEALQVKHPINDWEIHTEGQRTYWKIIRLGGNTTVYQFFVDMLKHFDREDLNQLWTLVKETLSIKQATSDKEKELWVERKRLYEPDVEDQLWT
nr:uncharacterized mitochondrial protein AtMg00810-like [Tanacetum cinerariifolium]